MDYIFQLKDKTSRIIYLSKERWKHIRIDHPDVKEDEIKLTLKKPIRIIEKRNNKYFYFQYFKYKKPPAKFLRVIVKYLNGNGYIISSHFIKNIS